MAKSKQDAFMDAYQVCHEPFIRYCSALAFGKMETEDLVQDVLLSAFQHFEKIEKKDALLHYLVRSARNRMVSWWRKGKFKAELLEKHTLGLEAKGLSPELSLDIQLLYRMLEQLPVHQKEALVLFEISGFSMKEIAEMQNSSEGAVKTKISRGRKKLTNLMSEKNSLLSLPTILKTAQTILL